MVAADAEQHAGWHDPTTATGPQLPASFTPAHPAGAIDADCISPAVSSAIRVCARVRAGPESSSGTRARGNG